MLSNLKSLSTIDRVGKRIELPPLMPGLCKEPVVATLVEYEEGKYWEFELTYFNVWLGNTYIEKKNGKLEYGDL